MAMKCKGAWEESMVTDQSDKEPRWLAASPPYEFTRGELLELMQIMGHPMTERRLRNWADRDLLPPPSKRAVPPGAPDRVARALYPVWTIALLDALYRRSERNETIEEMKAALPDIRADLERWAGLEQGVDLLMKHRLIALRDGQPRARRVGEGWPTATITPVSGPKVTIASVDPHVTRALQRAAWACAEEFVKRADGEPVQELLLLIFDAEGQRTTVPIPSPPPPRKKRRKDA